MKKNVALTLIILFFGIALHAQIDRSKPPKAGPSPEINLKEPHQFAMKNGLQIMVVEDHKLPRVSVQLLIDNPPILEGEKAGVSTLTASLLGKGSKSISMEDFNEEVDYLGATINFGSQSAFASSLSKYFPRILELMTDAGLNPNFTQEEFEKEKAKLITNLKSQEKDVSAIAGRVEGALAYGKNHPYGEFLTEESVNHVTLQDVQQFYSDYFVPANAYLVIIGDVKFKDAKKLAEKHFTPWTKATPPSFKYTAPSNAQYTQINFIDVPNAVQSEIWVGNLVNLKMADKDYLSALMANRILGGGAQGRLFQNLREDKAYTYGSYSGIGNDKYAPATFRASASVRNAVTDSAVVEILKEIDNIIKTPVSEEELSNAKATYIGNFVLALEKPETMAKYAINMQTEGLPDDFYKTYLERINAISIENVHQAAKKYLTTDNARVVVTGKGNEVLKNLENVTFDGETVPVKYYDKYANLTEKPDYGAELPEGVTVESVINSFFEAIGGKEAIDKVTSLKLVYEGEAMGSKIKTEEIRTSDRYAQTTFMNDAPMMGVIAKGDELYMKQGDTKVPVPPQMQEDLAKAIGVFPEQGFLSSGLAKLTGMEEIEGKKAYKIEVPGETVHATYFYDIESGLKIKEAITINMNGQTQNQEINYKDYEIVDGIKFAKTKSSSMGPQMVETKLLEAVINPEISDTDFE